MFASAHALLSLPRVHLGGAGDDHRLQARLFQGLAQVTGPVRNAPLVSNRLGARWPATCKRHDLDVGNVAHGLQVANAKGALAYQSNLHPEILVLPPPSSPCHPEESMGPRTRQRV